MKQLLKTSLIALLLCSANTSGFGQMSNLNFYSEQGERFWVVVNGVKLNRVPKSAVSTEVFPHPGIIAFSVKIMFENSALQDVDRKIYPEPNQEITYAIIKTVNNIGNGYTLRLKEVVDIGHVVEGPGTVGVVPPASYSDNVEVNVNIGGTYFGGTNVVETPVAEEIIYVEGYTGPIGCPIPMSDRDFSSARNSIQSKSFSSSKLTTAKQVARSNCLTADQVRQIVQLFDFEHNKLNYAKFAYDYTYDLGNYYKVNDAFEFEHSIRSLENYIRNK